jgi:hypothetical protein
MISSVFPVLVSVEEYEAELEQAADQLIEIAAAFNEPVESQAYQMALVSLGHRARTLFQAFRELQAGSVPVAARALLRPMAEINMLVRFLRKEPDLHTELWQAEGERNSITIADEIRSSEILQARLGGVVPLDDRELETRREKVAEVRGRARAAGLAGKKGPILPTVGRQRKIIDEAATTDVVYTLVYRIASWDVHISPRTFLAGIYAPRNDGTVSYEENPSPKTLLSIRALAVTTFASTIEAIAAELHLPIEGDAHDILSRAMALEPAFGEGG